MSFDNKDLIELIDKKFRTHRDFSIAMGWSDAKTSYKLKGFARWSHIDIDKAVSVLGIPASQIKRYFFTHSVQ